MTAPAQVRLLLRFTDPELDWSMLAAGLPAAAQLRLEKMRAQGRRREFILGRVLASRLLRDTLGGTDWDLVPRPGGKPVAIATDGRVHAAISISHSRGQVLCAAAPTGQLGCDIEVLRPRSQASWRRMANAELAHPVFAPHERLWILAADGVARDRRLYALWTIKEAIGKASGRGLLGHLADVVPDLGRVGDVLAASVAGGRWAGAGDAITAAAHGAPAGGVWHWQLLFGEHAIIAVAADAPLQTAWHSPP